MSAFQDLPSTTDDLLLDSMSTADIFCFGRTSKSAHHKLQSYLKRRYRLHHALSRFFTEDQTEELRTLMSGTGMLISGSVALQFLDRTVYPDSDLDLYVPFKYARQIADWLVSAGYTYSPKRIWLSTVDTALRRAAARHLLAGSHTGDTPATERGYMRATCVLDFMAGDPPRKIQLISTLRSTIELILSFHSTCVMNFITHNAAYSLFPRATFEERRALTYINPASAREAHQIAYHKYVGRGWQLVENITRQEFDNPCSPFLRGTRFIGDRKCWTLPILPARGDLPERNACINSFALDYDENLGHLFSFRHLDLPGLQQPYLLQEHEADYVMERCSFRCDFQVTEDYATGTDTYGSDSEDENSEESRDEAGEAGNEDDGNGNGHDDSSSGENQDENNSTESHSGNNCEDVAFDHILKLLVGEIRKQDVNNN